MVIARRTAGKKISVRKLYQALTGDARLLGPVDGYILSVASIGDADKHALSFCLQRDKIGLELIRKSKARVVICSDELNVTEEDYRDRTLILVPNPKLALTRVMQTFFQEEVKSGIDSTAVVDKDAKIYPDVYIGPHCYIGKCQVGEGTIIYGNTYIYSGVKIGKRVVIHAGTVIGAEGMEFTRNEKGQFEKYPHIGGITIEDDVWMGSHVSIMKGVFKDTIIGQGTKLGAFCSIGHEANIGKHCLIITCSVIGGSCRIGDYSRVSLGACVRDGIEIGKNALIGMGSVVTKNVGDGQVVFGVPAREHKKLQ